MTTLAVEKRDTTASLSALRQKGFIPAVVYGAHQEATSISVDAKSFMKALKEAGEATIVSLSGLGAALPTLIHEIAHDPLTGHPVHVDFYAVTKGEKVEIAIPLTFEGESAAVEAGANLVKVMHEVQVKADPVNLPHSIAVDISVLAIVNDQIHAKDLKLPNGVELMNEPEDVVALVQEVVEEAGETAPVDIGAIEVEKKGKEEDSGASTENA